MSRSKDRMKFAIESIGIENKDIKVGDIITFIHPKYHSFQTQKIHKIKGKKITMKNCIGEFTHITEKNIRKIIEER